MLAPDFRAFFEVVVAIEAFVDVDVRGAEGAEGAYSFEGSGDLDGGEREGAIAATAGAV